MISNSTGAPSGRLATPYTKRQGLLTFRGQHPAQKKQIARLHRFHVGAEWLGRRRELDAKFFQPLLGTRQSRVVYHVLVRICFHFSYFLFFFGYRSFCS